MDDYPSGHFVSPPSSLLDGLTSAQGTVPPVPRPRRGSTSTPKQVINFHGSLTRNNQSCSSTGSCNRSKTNKMHRTSSIDSSGNCEIKIKPIDNFVDNSDADSEEDDCHFYIGNSNDRNNSNCRSKRSHPRFASRSLPVTPRVNGNCSTTQTQLNGGISSSFLSGSIGSSTPLLVAPHLASHFPLDGSYNSISSLSPVASQYVTCSSGIMSESQDKILPGSIDYSSLPLPKEESVKTTNKRNISRHMSEPCIHEIPNLHLGNTIKCHSCPNRKISSKHKKRENFSHSGGSDTPPGLENQLRNSLSGIDSRTDGLETVEMQWKFIKTLIDELNKCRCQNNRMAVELHQSQMEIQMLKGALDAYAEAGVQSGVLTEMVGQIHAAQKIRDEAMMSRIKLANEERDSAINQFHQLLEKFGFPQKPADAVKMSSFHFGDQSNLQTPLPKKENLNLASIEDELKALKLAVQIPEMERTSSFHIESPCCRGKDSGGESQELLEELKAKLKESEVSKQKLQERCSSLEHFFSHLNRKVNGLSSFDGISSTSLNPASMTVLDMSIFGNKNSNGSSHHRDCTNSGDPDGPPSPAIRTSASGATVSATPSGQDECLPSPRRRRKISPDEKGKGSVFPSEGVDTETDGDSLSSSADSSSAASWKHVCGPGSHIEPSDSSSHSSLPPHSRQSSLSLSLDGMTNNNNNSNGNNSISSSSINNNNNNNGSNSNGNSSSLERSNGVASHKNEYKPRNLGGVTLMGPITEL